MVYGLSRLAYAYLVAYLYADLTCLVTYFGAPIRQCLGIHIMAWRHKAGMVTSHALRPHEYRCLQVGDALIVIMIMIIIHRN